MKSIFGLFVALSMLLAVFAGVAAASGTYHVEHARKDLTLNADALEQMALDYDDWLQEWHVPGPYGSLYEVQFTDSTDSEVYYYEGRWDSTLWTGIYAGAECLRYNVTADSEAQDNAIAALTALHHHLKVTQLPGYVARFVAPNEWMFVHGHETDSNCHDGEGDYAGTRWCENTSRDQYTGWWFAQSVCYDFLEDEPTREQIRTDVAEVTQYFRDNAWLIMKPSGEMSTAAGFIDFDKRMDWLLIASHILDSDNLYAAYENMFNHFSWFLPIDAWSLYNRYHDYYGNQLRHVTFFNLWRLESDPVRYAVYADVMKRMARPYTEWTHNPWLDALWLYGCRGNDTCGTDEDRLADYILTDIAQFFPPPNRHVPVAAGPDYEADPVPIWWNAIIDDLIAAGLDPTIGDELKLREQPLYAQEVRYQCHDDFQWQCNPFHSGVCNAGDDGSFVSSGVDYIAVYWLARWMDVMPPGNPNFPGWQLP